MTGRYAHNSRDTLMEVRSTQPHRFCVACVVPDVGGIFPGWFISSAYETNTMKKKIPHTVSPYPSNQTHAKSMQVNVGDYYLFLTTVGCLIICSIQ
jgi:hypothetical protein